MLLTPRVLRSALVALALVPLLGSRVRAQVADSAKAGVRPRPDSARRAAPPPARGTQKPAARPVRDSLAPPISPKRAFLYSLAFPGLGQSRLQRPSAGALYTGFELVSIAMLGKSRYDLSIAKRRIKEKIASSYKTVGGVVQFDSLNRPIADSTLTSRYDITGTDQLRSRLKARRLHYEDWVSMLAFTHLFAGADAFVSAHLWDLPRQVEFRRLPSGATGIGARLEFR